MHSIYENKIDISGFMKQGPDYFYDFFSSRTINPRLAPWREPKPCRKGICMHERILRIGFI